jgi:hypothetical protein
MVAGPSIARSFQVGSKSPVIHRRDGSNFNCHCIGEEIKTYNSFLLQTPDEPKAEIYIGCHQNRCRHNKLHNRQCTVVQILNMCSLIAQVQILNMCSLIAQVQIQNMCSLIAQVQILNMCSLIAQVQILNMCSLIAQVQILNMCSLIAQVQILKICSLIAHVQILNMY